MACWFQQSQWGHRSWAGGGWRLTLEGGEVCWKSPSLGSRRRFKDAFPALFGLRKWAVPGLLAERPTRDSCADEVVELVPARRRVPRAPAGCRALRAPSPTAILCSTPESPPSLLPLAPLSLSFFLP